jgi:hypothetical protein
VSIDALAEIQYSLDMRRLVLISALLALPAVAAAADTAVDTAIRTTFVAPWVQAVLANDSARLTRFLHPKVRACITEQTRDFFDREDSFDPKSSSAKYRITKLAPIHPPLPLFGLPEDGFPFPVQPTWEVQVEFEQSNTLVIRWLAPSAGSWFIAVPCPNEKGMAFLREQIVIGNEQKRRAAALLADLKDPLLSELKELLSKGQRIDAIKRYQQATGQEDLTLAVIVVKAIKP